ncbi:MAG: hypothetical protein ACJ76D_09595 [Solirubrobacterales bacterium]
MKNKMMLLALGLLALVFAAMPAVASAGTPEIDSPSLNIGKSLSFTSAGGHSELRASGEPTITCTSNVGSGKYTSKTTGEVSLTFSGCTGNLGFLHPECHTTGQSNGVIATATSVFHNVYLTDAKTTPGILVTPPTGGVFATIICAGFSNIEVKGNGVIGDLASPGCGKSSATGTLSFTATGSAQTYKQNTATGTIYNLTSTTEGGGSPVEAAEVAEGKATFAEEITVTCV